jgi:hypothetical protein
MSQGLPEGDEGESEVEEGTVVSADSFPSDEQPEEAVVPGVGALHDPAARLARVTGSSGLQWLQEQK